MPAACTKMDCAMYTQNKGHKITYPAGRVETCTMLITRALRDRMSIQWGTMGMAGCALLVLTGCVAYHGPTSTSTNREVIRSSVGSLSMKVTAMVRNSSLVVHVDTVEPIEKVEKEITTSQYVTYQVPSFTSTMFNVLLKIPVNWMFWPVIFHYNRDIAIDPPDATDEPYVPVLSAVACRIVPGVWCVGTTMPCPVPACHGIRPVEGETEKSKKDEKVVSRTTESQKTSYSGPIWVLVGSEKVRLDTDYFGDATMPLSQQAVRTLLNGQESLLLRVSLQE